MKAPEPLRSVRGRAAVDRGLARGRGRPRRSRHRPPDLHHRHAAAQRHGGAAHGPRAQQHDPGRAHPRAPDGRRRDAVGLRHRPRRHRHPGGGGEEPRRPGRSRASSSGARSSTAASGSGRSSTAAPSSSQLQRLGCTLDYERERFTMDDGYAVGGAPRVRGPVREGLHLPRPLHGQLGPGPRLGHLGPGGRGPRGHRQPGEHRLPARRRHRRAGGGHGPPRDDARRHRRRREPRRRALPRRDRHDGDPAADGPRDPGRGRRLRADRLRHRRPQGHARRTTPTTSRSPAATTCRSSTSSARTAA